MKFIYSIDSNIKIGQKLWIIVAMAGPQFESVYEGTIQSISYDSKEVIFKIYFPERFLILCPFSDMDTFVFKAEDEARNAKKSIGHWMGLKSYFTPERESPWSGYD